MTRDELEKRVGPVASLVAGIGDDLFCLLRNPAYDEDYKVERETRFTPEFFDRLKELAEALSEHAMKIE